MRPGAGTVTSRSSLEPSDTRLFLLASLVAAIWGFNFVVIKVATDGVPPLLLAGLRFTLLAFPAVLVVRRPRASWYLVAGYGLLLGVGQFGLLFSAIRLGAPPGISATLLQSQALFTALLSAWLLDERLGLCSGVGLLVSTAGLTLIAACSSRPGAWAGNFGVCCALLVLAGLMWGMANVVAKRIGDVGAIRLIVWASLAPPLPLFALALHFEGAATMRDSLSTVSTSHLAALAYLVLLSTLVGYGCWNHLIVQYGASRVAPFALLVPVLAMGSSALCLREPVALRQVVATVVVLVGLGVHVRGARLQLRTPCPILRRRSGD